MGGDEIPNCELAEWMPLCEGGWHLWFVIARAKGEYRVHPPCDDLENLAATIGSAGVPFCGCLDVRSALELVLPRLRERING
jgi:hypothetical protein